MPTISQTAPKTPPLQPGDHLSVQEFERRYRAMPEVKKAELIEGVVYMPSPVTSEDHGAPHANLISWMGWYKAFTVGVQVADNSTVRLKLGANQPQPDCLLRILPEYGGQSKTSADGYVLLAPELVGEVAASSASYDLHEKLEAYERNGVLEYIVWRVEDHEIDWFHSKSGKLRRLALSSDGIHKSKCFAGLWLEPRAMVDDRLADVLGVLQQGLATREHAQFVERLAKQQAHRSVEKPP